MHPRGAVFDAVLDADGSDPPWGVPVAGRDRRATTPSSGCPGVPVCRRRCRTCSAWRSGSRGSTDPVDLLLTTAGRGAADPADSVPRRDTAAVYSSIMGYRSDAGVLRLAALPDGHGVPSEPAPLAARRRPGGSRLHAGRRRGGRPVAALRPADPRRAPRSAGRRRPVRRRPEPAARAGARRADGPLPGTGVCEGPRRRWTAAIGGRRGRRAGKAVTAGATSVVRSAARHVARGPICTGGPA